MLLQGYSLFILFYIIWELSYLSGLGEKLNVSVDFLEKKIFRFSISLREILKEKMFCSRQIS